jgi:hypothetical protein
MSYKEFHFGPYRFVITPTLHEIQIEIIKIEKNKILIY